MGALGRPAIRRNLSASSLWTTTVAKAPRMGILCSRGCLVCSSFLNFRPGSGDTGAQATVFQLAEMKGRLSGLQKQVLSLHRSFLRAARVKPPETREQLEKFVNVEFRRNAAIDKKNYQQIEYLIRQGHKQLEMLRSSDGFSVVELK